MPTIWHLLSQLSASLPWLPCYSSEFSEGNIANKEILSPLIRANSCPILCTHKQTILTPPVKTDLEHLIINRLQILKPTRIKSSFWAWGEGKDWDIFASTCDANISQSLNQFANLESTENGYARWLGWVSMFMLSEHQGS